jgi:hypothetical protein
MGQECLITVSTTTTTKKKIAAITIFTRTIVGIFVTWLPTTRVFSKGLTATSPE